MAAIDPNLSLSNEPISVWFWGHSFIGRLQDFCIKKFDTHANMGLVPESHLIFFKSRSGGLVTHCKPDLKIINQVDAELVFLDIGSNDIDNQRVSPQVLAQEVLDIAQLILRDFKEVKMVVKNAKLTSTDLPKIWYVRPVSDSKPFQPTTFDLGDHWRSKVK